MERNLLQEGLWETEGVLPYDAACKRLLSEREILARIMKECLPEYGQCTVEDIAFRYIKDDPLVDGVPLRGKAPRVGGLRNDEAVPHEGRVTYDIRFTAEAPGVEGPIGLIVNVEAHRRSDQGRRLMSRAMSFQGGAGVRETARVGGRIRHCANRRVGERGVSYGIVCRAHLF